MNAMAEKLEEAGVDTIGARLTAACIEGIRRHPESSMDAWNHVFSIFGYQFVSGLMNDMKGSARQKEQRSPPAHALGVPAPKPYQPRVIPPERLEKRRALQQVVRIQFGYKTADNTDWADVGAHELDGMDRDGAMARAVKARIGVLTNEDRFRTVGDLMTAKQFNEVVDQVRKHPINVILK